MSLTFTLQALLVRHESYVADSERERHNMLRTIENLEREKRELEDKNAQTIKANRDLLDQLEHLNGAVADSDAQIKALTDTLHSTEDEIQRLSSLAARTQMLERQLIELEREQVSLQGTLDDKVGDERTAIQRWRRAEKTIGDLQDQIDRIEKEAKEERERHVEIVARMERRMAVDQELATAAGRLKAKAGQQEKPGTNVVSHFVKDILLDNANLQHGILELRDMLTTSNEEVERLRDQLRAHQPVSPVLEHSSNPVATATSLQKELGNETIFNQELHIHHHYHGPPPKKEPPKAQAPRRPKKKRYSLTPGHFMPPALQEPSAPAAILSQTAVSVPPNPNRWSNATTLCPPSLPGSPLSVSHRDSIYDRVFSDAAYDSSRPTSPSDSVNPASPMFEPSKYAENSDGLVRHKRRTSQSLKPPSLATIRSVSSPIALTTKSSATAVISAVSPAHSLSNDIFTLSPSLHSTIPEEDEESRIEEVTHDDDSVIATPSPAQDLDLGIDFDATPSRPTIRRAASHESLISISGMDIHTLQSRPAQLLLSSSPRFASHAPASSSIEPELTPWTATASARMSTSRPGRLDTRSLLYGSMVAQKRSTSASKQTPSPSSSYTGVALGKKVGGWVFGKWGATPAPTSPSPLSPRPESSASSQSAQTVQSSSSASKKTDATTAAAAQKKKDPAPPRLRPSGVNQSGPIWGFFDIPETPTKVVVTADEVDADALGEALEERAAATTTTTT
ncbi:hypothetical protein BU24DRAFT_420935 [Aaosphaeria arxii CBS 175.79]|uniref:Uncharacterized protein n=1 Tax=Aaosphaeria arxii CBS 175.79 TaxID=1450172 RepID=A0A6A5XYG3_9PLEO|nr:uncharacterized protein BU24DRAFT_420935 [Aaosphaeria arxii CBS 175.79]KAF2017877.1 hypothetical protein BU24DRAFT_420935 [Aaosphaeria arxii CBS 175.79]